ncbi:MAG: prepilin peptidase [Acidobacteriia bacterium]|nr:prepilin peptidase [Terriglobia bacterium]
MTLISPTEFAAAALVVTAAVSDFRRRRIPNWLTLGGIVGGLLLGARTGGWAGMERSLGGMLLGFAAYFALYCLHAMGAGDVKLMAAVGAVLGPANWVAVLLATAIAGGVLAAALMIAKGRVRETLWNTGYILSELAHFRPPYKRRSHLDVRHPGSLNMPHGIAIAAGTIFCLFWAHTR